LKERRRDGTDVKTRETTLAVTGYAYRKEEILEFGRIGSSSYFADNMLWTRLMYLSETGLQ